jgi:predicted amino acid-binding ACT domain protein
MSMAFRILLAACTLLGSLAAADETLDPASITRKVVLTGKQPLRVLAVDWGDSSPERTFPASIRIEAFDRRGLVRDISAVLADERISIEAMNTVTNSAENTATVDHHAAIEQAIVDAQRQPDREYQRQGAARVHETRKRGE